jgi:protein SCO1/2
VRRFPERITPRYLMMDQFGRSVSNRDFDGRVQLINFGYTYCPDVCPTSLAVMSQTMKLLDEDADQVQPIFITVDPERDRPEILKEYLAYFDERLIGLSASPEVTKRTAELFKARYHRVPAEGADPRRYTMDHTASLYLLGRKGEYLTKFAHGLPAQEVAERIRDYLRE